MKTALISGGAGGLGKALIRQLQQANWRVIALDLDISSLHESDTLWPIACDLTDPDELQKTANRILGKYQSLDLIIYNAGVTQIMAFDQSTEDSHKAVFDVNYFAAVSMVRHFLEAVRIAKGTHLVISSVAGFTPLYHRTAYAASKHALEGFFKSLRSEERENGSSILIAAPSFIATNIGQPETTQEGIARPGSATDGKDYMDPDTAAHAILKGFAKKQPMILVGRVAKFAWWINRLSPRLFQRIMERQIAGTQE
ncbi:SDR family NAD(P)-dependent oxidoreductase [Sneathiella sp.]|jgi:short-subunit dehydrogenase|uniref:SDR family NAD(P)-dependent oxidoreductase n=1 Tax=Sneathiella sp. TaxID=1964365 RepID=UPI0039E5927A